MKKSTGVLLAMVLLSLVELILIRPLVPAFFGMTPMWQFLYVVVLYGFPLLVLLPILLLTLPFALFGRKGRGFKSSWMLLSKKTYLFVSIFFLLMNTLVVAAKYATDIPVFPLVRYSEIKGADTDLHDLKQGKFKSQFAVIERRMGEQVETYFQDNKQVTFRLTWLSSNEYRLITEGQPLGMSDTVDVKVTANFRDYYECYVRFGEYAGHQRIEKIK